MLATLLLAASCCSPVKDAPVDYAALSEPVAYASPRVLACIFPGRRARREAAIAVEASALTAASLAPALSSSMLMQAAPMALQAAPMAVAQSSGCYEASSAFQAAPQAAPMAAAPSSCYSSTAPMQAAPPSYQEVQSVPAFASSSVPILTSVPTYRYAPGVTAPLMLQAAPMVVSGGCPGGVCPPSSGGFLARMFRR